MIDKGHINVTESCFVSVDIGHGCRVISTLCAGI
jgi:hypothetical protein